MKFAANLSLLWPELPFLDRFDAAAAAGFDAVEILFPYDTPAPETQAALGRNGLSLILINAPPPNYTGGPRGFAAQPDAVDRFRHDMRRAFRYATALGVPMIHVMAGEAQGDAARATFIENLRWAATEAPKGISLTIEPLNPVAMPGYFLNDYALAAEILAAVAAPNVALQYDSYHAQMIHGDAVAVLDAYRDIIAHVQIGDSPDRSAPGSGEVDFDQLFARLEATEYQGYVSGEYHPGGPTEKTLNWTKRR
ncbi:Hydroxypyruvate isomerase [Sulfitobacter sp. THAF37]|uniref:hydroxypyruvate isomerase family protein n=1 Tax=Sulfitobacter sp. THAF37 TaxID=2587855 RepID=UPI00126894D3|nr:TIM barrel protein [Sulfitobacter sp. THAF37]QFT58435.1 Hydroxypyruvate isomerase [Sulfitobacter sp. THAF37]